MEGRREVVEGRLENLEGVAVGDEQDAGVVIERFEFVYQGRGALEHLDSALHAECFMLGILCVERPDLLVVAVMGVVQSAKVALAQCGREVRRGAIQDGPGNLRRVSATFEIRGIDKGGGVEQAVRLCCLDRTGDLRMTCGRQAITRETFLRITQNDLKGIGLALAVAQQEVVIMDVI